jgi:hypothetical protein
MLMFAYFGSTSFADILFADRRFPTRWRARHRCRPSSTRRRW